MNAYCEVDEVGTLGINAEAIAGIEPEVVSAEIAVQRAFMDGFFGDRFTLPITAWDDAVRKCCAVLTGAGLLRTRGYNPEADPSVKDVIMYWTDWLKGIADGRWRPAVTDSSSKPAPNGQFGAGGFVTARSRGLTVRGTGRCRQPFQGD
jgi:phage gp36-like protein